MLGITYVMFFFKSSATTKLWIICRIGEKYWARRSFHWSTLRDVFRTAQKENVFYPYFDVLNAFRNIFLPTLCFYYIKKFDLVDKIMLR